MELKIMTPSEVWEDFDPSLAPSDISTESETESGNLKCLKQYFSFEEREEDGSKGYMEIYFDSRWEDARAAILLLPPLDGASPDTLISRLVAEGYVVGLLDYAAKTGTFYPSSLQFATYPDCLEQMDDLKQGSARKSPWFVWSKLARRGISLLEAFKLADSARIGVIGIGAGAHIAWQIAGMDKRVGAVVPICGGGYRWAKQKPRFVNGNVPTTEEEIAFSTGVGAETYAKMVTCPTFYMTSRMSEFCDVDRAGDILDLVKSPNKKLLIMRSVDMQITERALGAMLSWLRASFSGDKGSATPTISFEVVGDNLYLKTHTVHKAKEASVYISSGEPSPYARHWTKLANLQKVGVHEYTVKVPVVEPEQLLIAYATFQYEGDDASSTPVVCAIPSKLGIAATDPGAERSRIIYDSTMDADMFSIKTGDAILEDGVMCFETGPYQITGVTAKKGSLLLCRSEQEISSLTRMSALHFDAYSASPRELEVSIFTPDQKKYTARTMLEGGEFWQKILLSSADFKTEEGRMLAKFSNAKVLTIYNANGVLFNNFLWI